MNDFDLLDGLRPHIDDWSAFVDACRRPLPPCLWVNRLRSTPDEVRSLLEDCGIGTMSVPWHEDVLRFEPVDHPGSTFPFLAGLCHIQEEVSTLAAYVMDAHPAERILDLCAAPGGKTAWMAGRMKNTGTIVANDRSAGRLRPLRGNLDRLGVVNVSVTRADAGSYPAQAGPFDRVLADVPCSCTGTIRKNPAVLAEVRRDPPRISGLQQAILRRAVELCRPGGRILYATCAFEPEENEAVVAAILRERDELSILPVDLEGFSASPGLTEWSGQRYPDELGHARRIYPHQNDTGGFFLALLEKADE